MIVYTAVTERLTVYIIFFRFIPISFSNIIQNFICDLGSLSKSLEKLLQLVGISNKNGGSESYGESISSESSTNLFAAFQSNAELRQFFKRIIMGVLVFCLN